MSAFDDRFPPPELDRSVWTPSYLPAWSSRAAAAASYRVDEEGLRLSIPDDHPVWCPDLHHPPLRVSAVQSGNWSGPVGSTRGQQPFREGLVVREEQPESRGFVPLHGRVEVECRAVLGPRSMFSAWLIGMEDRPDRCGEICLVEVFGDAIDDRGAALGTGIHPFRDPALHEEFSAEHRAIDVAQLHRYAVDRRPDGVDFLVDGEVVRRSAQSPAYPMLLIIGLFDFPDRAVPGTVEPPPELVVRRVVGTGPPIRPPDGDPPPAQPPTRRTA
ncbi:glycoside hydrolase family 16 protein [Pseudonocardia petroleophila]|uniref:Glycoside hydrolase family 16 protein n=1 Tax=Pseudonocardia petroleophila TaxID=37331 RepID=A0A7G7MPQ3_9PSEU|nr:glycoside hydrolase family 16 protein [Pseudonocardia petroleophila]QNG54764.1 glycoside hydrolase family 16 protein [Pseudonocardia petroleophila]